MCSRPLTFRLFEEFEKAGIQFAFCPNPYPLPEYVKSTGGRKTGLGLEDSRKMQFTRCFC